MWAGGRNDLRRYGPGGGGSRFFVYRHLTYERNKPIVHFSPYASGSCQGLSAREPMPRMDWVMEKEANVKKRMRSLMTLGRFLHDFGSRKRLGWRDALYLKLLRSMCAFGPISLLLIFVKPQVLPLHVCGLPLSIEPFYPLQISMVRCQMGSPRSAGEQEQVIGWCWSSLLKGSHPGCTQPMIDHECMSSSRDLYTAERASPTRFTPTKTTRSAPANAPFIRASKPPSCYWPALGCNSALMKQKGIRAPNKSSAEPPFKKIRVLLPS